MTGEDLIGRVEQAFADALGDVEVKPRDGAAVELARLLCEQIDRAGDVCEECGRPGPELIKLTGQLGLALEALLMTPRSIAAAVGRREGEPSGGPSLKAVRLHELRSASARQRGTSAVDPTTS